MTPPGPRAILVSAAGVRVWRSHGNQGIFFHAGFEFTHHLQHRAEYPAVGNHLVLVLPRVGIQVNSSGIASLTGGETIVSC